MSSQILGALLLLSQLVCANDNGLTPRELTATALNSSAIRVTWKEPSRSAELNGRYELMLYNGTQEEEFNIEATEDIITDLEPSTTYDVDVSAFWSNGTAVVEYASASVTTFPREASPPLASESSREADAEGELPSTEESPDVLVDLHNESSSDKTLSSFTDQPPVVQKEGEVTEEEKKIGNDKEKVLSDSHNSNPEAKDVDLGPSDGIVPTLVEFSETDEIHNMSNDTFSSESPDKPNSSEVIKGSFISLAGFSLLWLSSMFAL
ncbi:hypothetical protein SprV_0100467100 [Sparganum proliferum]